MNMFEIQVFGYEREIKQHSAIKTKQQEQEKHQQNRAWWCCRTELLPPPPPHTHFFVTFPFFSGYEDRSESILSRWRASRVKTEYKEIRKIGKQNRHVKYITFIYLFKGISCILDWSRAFVQTCNFKQDVLKIDKQMTSFRKFNKCCSFWGLYVCTSLSYSLRFLVRMSEPAMHNALYRHGDGFHLQNICVCDSSLRACHWRPVSMCHFKSTSVLLVLSHQAFSFPPLPPSPSLSFSVHLFCLIVCLPVFSSLFRSLSLSSSLGFCLDLALFSLP